MAKKADHRISVRPPAAYRVVAFKASGGWIFEIAGRNGGLVATSEPYTTRRRCMVAAGRLVRCRFDEVELGYAISGA
jgi:uncharacterized protein YegP (UPF0339 family)